MKATKILFLSMATAALFASCGQQHDDDNPTGAWTASAPESVTQAIADATSATKTVSIDFAAPVGEADGVVTLSADYDITVPYVTDSTTNATSYKATATISGTWTQDVDDHDDYLLTFDTNSLAVNGVNAPVLGPVTDEFLSSVKAFTTIEDVEVSKDGTHLTFETKHPDVKYHFVKK